MEIYKRKQESKKKKTKKNALDQENDQEKNRSLIIVSVKLNTSKNEAKC